MAELRIVDDPHAEALRQIVRDVDARDIRGLGLTDYTSVTLLLKDPREEVRGGLLGVL